MPVKINGSTSGSVTLAAPATGSDVSLTLPTLGFGKVLQVVTASSSTNVSTSSTSFTDLLSASITPSSASSRILVLASCSVNSVKNTNAVATVSIDRDSTQIFITSAGNGGATDSYDNISISVLDSPASTSALTYKLRLAKGSSNTTSVNTNTYIYSLTVIEVGP